MFLFFFFLISLQIRFIFLKSFRCMRHSSKERSRCIFDKILRQVQILFKVISRRKKKKINIERIRIHFEKTLQRRYQTKVQLKPKIIVASLSFESSANAKNSSSKRLTTSSDRSMEPEPRFGLRNTRDPRDTSKHGSRCCHGDI